MTEQKKRRKKREGEDVASKETGFSLVRDVCSHSLDCDDDWIIRGMKSGEIGWDDWIIRGVTSLRMDGSGQVRDEDGDHVRVLEGLN